MLRTALRNVLAHKRRLLTTAIAIVLSVSFMTGTLVLTDTIGRTFDNLFASVYQGTDAVVRAKAAFEGPTGTGLQRGRVPQSLLATVSRVPGVAQAGGGVFGYARLVDKQGKAMGNPENGAPTLGTAWPTESRLNPFVLTEGRAPRSPHEVVIDKKSATDAHYAVGDTATVLVNGPPQTVRIVGIARFGTADSPGGASTVIFDVATAQRLVAQPGMFDSIDIAAARGVSQTELVARLAKTLPTGVEAVTGRAIIKESQNQMRKALGFFNTFLLVFVVVALLVGGFMMLNTFAITVAQRTRQNGLLRALGASRRQVLLSVVLEAAIVGVIASLAGILLGIAVAVGLKSLLSGVGIDIPSQGVVVEFGSLALSFGVGLAITVLSAWSPARKAAKVSPLAAMQLGVVGSAGYGSKQRILVGLSVLSAGVAALLLGLFGSTSATVQIVGTGAVLVFLGVSVLGRTVSLPLSRTIGWPLPRLRGIAGALARENAMRNPKRTAASASALMIGVGLVGFFTVFVSSTKASINYSVNKGFSGDIVLDTGALTGGVDPGLTRTLAALPEVSAAAGLRVGVAKVGSSAVLVQASDPAALSRIVDVNVVQGSIAGLGPDSIALYRSVADDHGWHLGDRVPFVSANGARSLRLDAIYDENAQIGNYFLSTGAYQRSYSNQYDRQVLVKRAAGTSTAQAMAAVKQVLRSYPGIKALDRQGYVNQQTSSVNQILALVYALLALAILIALLGIANTLALSISERIREIGLLRAVGMTRAQLRSVIRWESVIIAVQGTVLGLAIGLFFGWALVRALRDQGMAQLSLPYANLVAIVFIACIAGMVAAIPPSRHAARIDVLRAIVSD